MAFLTDFAAQSGISAPLLAVILIWTLTWKLLALWKSARNGQVIWFIAFVFVNTVGILPILYIYIFSKWKKKPMKKPLRKKAPPKEKFVLPLKKPKKKKK